MWNQAKHTKCAVRTDRWRLVDYKKLYDISADPGQAKDVAKNHPEVVAELQKKYDAWWDSLGPLLVNEGLPNIKPGDFPLQKRRSSQGELPLWEPIASK